ncbi:MAG: DUF2262 domain-containing protein [Chloroflexi bacterium]|nr:DUF2262 domain-containing protein [Chloroflexota bacterium]MCC6895400.1 DUF2262 domain-containing protein [Anaerolineae bacterium]
MDMNGQSGSSGNEMIVVGLVHPRGSGGFSIRTPIWTLRFTFSAWRDANNVLHRTDLLVKGDMTHDQLNDLMKDIHSLSIVKVRIRNFNNGTAEFVELIDSNVETDRELNQIAAEISQPLTYEHSRFGTFTFDRRVSWWQTSLEWVGQPIRLDLPGEADSPPDDDLLQTVTELWNNQSLWNQRVMDFAVQEKLPLKNEMWLDDDEQPLSPDEFKARMSLESISIYIEGGFAFWHDDGDLFFGHSILVTGNLQDGPTDTDIPG